MLFLNKRATGRKQNNKRKWNLLQKKYIFVFNLCEDTISRTDEGQPRPKYIFNKCGTNIYFFTLQRFGPSPSRNFNSFIGSSLKVTSTLYKTVPWKMTTIKFCNIQSNDPL